MTLRLSALFCAIVILVLNGCSTSSPTAPSTTSWNGDSTTCAVTYTDNTVYFDSLKVKDVISTDTAKHTMTISASSTLAPRLTVGNYILAWRQGMGRISAVQNSGSNIVVTTDSCSLDKIIKDGTLAFDYGVDFDPAKVILSSISFPHHGVDNLHLASSDTLGISVSYGNYNYTIAMKLQQQTAYVKIGVEKKFLQSSLRASFTAEGTINRFRQRTSMRFQASHLQSFTHNNNHMSGNLKLSIAAAGSANDALNIELPIIIAKYPVAVGPFIFFINVKIQVVANCVVPPDASSLVDVRIKYDSDLGFSSDGVNSTPVGREGSETMDRDGNMTTASSSQVAASFGVGFPRLELDMLGAGIIVPYVQPGFTVGGDYTTGIHPCMRGNAAFVGAAGINLAFAGIGYEKSYTLWNVQKVILKSGDCP